MAVAQPDVYRQAYQQMFSAAAPIMQLSMAYEAEKAVSVLLGSAYPYGGEDRRTWVTGFIDGFVKYLQRRRTPQSAAVLAGLASVAPGAGGDRAARAVQRMSQADVQAPPWASQTGQVHCTGAWQVSDLYGDQTHYIATFGYDDPVLGGPEHAACALVDHNVGVVADIVVACPASEVVEGWRRTAEKLNGMVTVAPVEPGLARGNVERHLPHTEALPTPPGGQQYLDNWAMVVSRFASLPQVASGPKPPSPEVVAETVVREFLESPHARRVAVEMAPSVDSGRDVVEQGARLAARYAVTANSGDPLRWSPEAVRRMLLEWMPKQPGVGAQVTQWLPAVLDAFAVYAAETRELPDEGVVNIRKTIAAVTEPYLKQVTEAQNGESMDDVLERMLDDGVDPTDEAAARRWLQNYLENRR